MSLEQNNAEGSDGVAHRLGGPTAAERARRDWPDLPGRVRGLPRSGEPLRRRRLRVEPLARDARAALGARLDGQLVASNFATSWGSVGF
jgi:hypothetical protein